jgi:hypothetical protein
MPPKNSITSRGPYKAKICRISRKTVPLKAQRISRTKITRTILGAAVAVIQIVPPLVVHPVTQSQTTMLRRKKRRKKSLIEKGKSLNTEFFLVL